GKRSGPARTRATADMARRLSRPTTAGTSRASRRWRWRPVRWPRNHLVMASINLNQLIRRMPWPESQEARHSGVVEREWLVTNGLGGYASGTISGACTRRYHGLLIAALTAPLGRQMMLNYLSEQVRLSTDKVIQIGAAEHDESPLELHGVEHLQEFRLEAG